MVTQAYTLEGEKNSIEVEENSMFFTYCQIPVIYTANKLNQIHVIYNDAEEELIEGNILSSAISESIFSRKGRVKYLIVKNKFE